MTGMSGEARVVITGMGAITPLGAELDCAWSAWQGGRSGIGPVTRFDASSWGLRHSAEVKDFDARPHFRTPKALKLADRKTQFAVAAASMAAAAAGLRAESFPMDQVGVCIGAGGSDFALPDVARALAGNDGPGCIEDIRFFGRRILSGLNPLWLLSNLPNMVSALVAIQVGVSGPNNTVMTDWVAGAQAIGEASGWIRSGEAAAVLAGGTDSSLIPQTFISGVGREAISAGAESGQFVPGEGAAIFVLEERDSAVSRGALIHGEVLSYATASTPLDAGDGGALSVTMGRVLREAGWTSRDLHAIGCATPGSGRGREAEVLALREIFGRAPEALPLVDFKSRIGHTLAASGAVELALMLKMMVQSPGRPVRALCNSLGRLGQAASLAVSLN